ncbi:MAG: class I SAM-dependent methyltransferase [Spongiibacteraceae bacterium]|jgi:predicted O-methyltransferase YrrM|nr:class I SAM-dependent methyltransferase [Spongiibacteraceae bacterium]
MSNRSIGLTDELYRYLLANSLREHALLAELRKVTAQRPDARMQIAPEQGQFMQLLVQLTGARRCLEIGVYTGYSALAVALALPEDGHVLACDIDAETTAIARDYWRRAGVESRIELRLAPALETLDQLLASGGADSYDFVFIDADKENYSEYYDRSLALLRQGGLIAVDNVLWNGRVADPAVNDLDTRAIRAFNRKLHWDASVSTSLVPVGDGLALARKL